MKKLVLLLIAVIGFNAYTIAQSYIETVYLRNGSIIKGTIIEQVPNTSLKIKTADGSIFVYNMEEVEKITKDEIRASRWERKAARNTLKGYKGFVDMGFIADVSDYDGNRVEVSTSHGYQFNNYIFLGGGIAVDYYTDRDAASFPIFANFRANFVNQKVSPFGDFKFGYTAGDDLSGGYISAALGVRFATGKKSAVNLRLEYVYQEEYLGSYYHSDNYWYDDYDYNPISGFGLKIGFEF